MKAIPMQDYLALVATYIDMGLDLEGARNQAALEAARRQAMRDIHNISERQCGIDCIWPHCLMLGTDDVCARRTR